MESLSIYVVTYNVKRAMPEQDLYELLSLSPNPAEDKCAPDFYMLCLQEVEATPLNRVIDALLDDPWTHNFISILKRRDYVKIRTMRLQGLVMCVFCLRKHVLHLRDVEYTSTRTGLLGFWGNKGAVTIRFTIYGCSICFLNSRFHPHDDALSSRIQDYNAIINAQIFHVPKNTDIFLHDYVFWAGDMNFGLMEKYDKNAKEVIKKIKIDELDDLLEHDQLRLIMDSGEAFGLFMEETPTFLPTYKYKIGTDEYDTKTRPAWTDRILYRINSGNPEVSKLTVDVHSYKSYPSYNLSDHKPVVAEFTVNVRGICDNFVLNDNSTHMVKFDKIQALLVKGERTCAIFEYTKDAPKYNDDWIGVFDVNFVALSDYLGSALVRNASKVPVETENKNGNGKKDAPPPPPTKYSIKFYELPRNLTLTHVKLIYFSCSECKVQAVLGISEPVLYAHKGF